MPVEKKSAKKSEIEKVDKVEPVVLAKKAEPTKSTSKAPVKEAVKETVKEAVKETVKETDKKTVKESSKKKAIEEEIVDDSDEDSDEESELEAGSEEENDTKKEKKAKKSFDELWQEYETNDGNYKAKQIEINEARKILMSKEKELKDLERQRSKIWAQLPKAKDDAVKTAAKSKPKRKGNKEGGFNKPVTVPLILSKYLGMEDGILMSRPKLMSALTDAFKEAGLKNGQLTTLDAKTAKALNKEKGREIPFGKFQTFLAEFFNESATNEVSL